MSRIATQFHGIHKVTKTAERVWVNAHWSIEVPVGYTYSVDPEFSGGGPSGPYRLHIQKSEDCDFSEPYSSVFNLVVYDNLFLIDRNCDDMSSDEVLNSYDKIPMHFFSPYEIYKCSKDLTIFYCLSHESDEYTQYMFNVLVRGESLAYSGQFNCAMGSMGERRNIFSRWIDTIKVLTQSERLAFTDYSGKSKVQLPTDFTKSMVTFDQGIQISVPNGFHAKTRSSNDERLLLIVPENYPISADPMNAPVALSIPGVQPFPYPINVALTNEYFELLCSNPGFSSEHPSEFYKFSTEAFIISQTLTNDDENWAMVIGELFANGKAYTFHLIINYNQSDFDSALAEWDIRHLANAWLNRIHIEGEKKKENEKRLTVEELKEDFEKVCETVSLASPNDNHTNQVKRMLMNIGALLYKNNNVELDSSSVKIISTVVGTYNGKNVTKSTINKEFNSNSIYQDPEQLINCEMNSSFVRNLAICDCMASDEGESNAHFLSNLYKCLISDYLYRLCEKIGIDYYTDQTCQSILSALTVLLRKTSSEVSVTRVGDKSIPVIQVQHNVFDDRPYDDWDEDDDSDDYEEEDDDWDEDDNSDDYEEEDDDWDEDDYSDENDVDIRSECIIEEGILKHYLGNSNHVVIPNGVTCIGYNAFYHKDIVSVVVPLGVENIEDSAFSSCKKLKRVSLPGTIRKIGQSAFSETAITEISIPEGVKEIGAYAFYKSAISQITIPEGITEIKESTFGQCKNLKSIGLPSTVQKIGGRAFADTAITEISIPEGVKEIEDHTFSGCKNLKSVVLPPSIQKIGGWAFYNNPISEIILPTNLESIGENAFTSTLLSEVLIPIKCQKIGHDCFSLCGSLLNIYVPSSVKEVGENAFMTMTYNTTLHTIKGCAADMSAREQLMPNHIEYGSSEDGGKRADAVRKKITKESPAIKDGLKNVLSYVENDTDAKASLLENGYEINKNGTLVKYTGRKKYIFIPQGVKSIDAAVFANKKSISAVVLPDSVRVIGDHAFEDCLNLEFVMLPPNLLKIGKCAFFSTALSEVDIPESCNDIGELAFYTCDGITIHAAEGSAAVKYAKDNELNTILYTSTMTKTTSPKKKVIKNSASPSEEAAVAPREEIKRTEETANIQQTDSDTQVTAIDPFEIDAAGTLIRYSGSTKDVVIPNGVTTIGTGAFQNNMNIISVTISDGVKTIQDCAFKSCENLKKISLPKTICHIGASAFYNTALTQITIPEGCETLGTWCFSNCAALKDVFLPQSITSIGNDAFFSLDSSLVIHAPRGSFPYAYAEKNHLTLAYDKGSPEQASQSNSISSMSKTTTNNSSSALSDTKQSGEPIVHLPVKEKANILPYVVGGVVLIVLILLYLIFS